MSAASDTLALEPREIQRPSALGGGWQRLRDVTWVSAITEFERRYHGSVLGYLWTLLRPLMLFAVLYAVVALVLDRFAEIPYYPMILLLGIVLYQFFADATSAATRSVIGRTELMRKAQFPRVAMPLSAVLLAAFTLATNLVVVLVWIVLYGIEPKWTWLLLPVILVPLVVLTAGVALLLSALSIRLRDVPQAWPIMTRLAFYASPILFPIEVIPGGLVTTAESVNPLAPIIVQARVWIIDSEAPGWFEWAPTPLAAITPFVVFGLLCLVGWLVFARQARRAAEEL